MLCVSTCREGEDDEYCLEYYGTLHVTAVPGKFIYERAANNQSRSLISLLFQTFQFAVKLLLTTRRIVGRNKYEDE